MVKSIVTPLVKVGMPPKEQLLPVLEEVLYSGMIAEGEYVYEFESKFKEMFHLPSVVATSSGTAALHIALILAGVQPGDSVISTSLTAEPTNTAILQSGADIIFADVDPETGNLSTQQVELSITSRTKAIVVVHYAGFPADLEGLRRVADRNGLALIEDAAHSLGAEYHQKPIGTIGDFGVFSLQAIKHMTTVDGGMLTLRNPERISAAKKLRWFGLEKGVPRTEINITQPGFKYNMHNVAAAIGIAQLGVIRDRIQRHINNGRFFDEEISKIPGLKTNRIEKGSKPSYWLYSVLSEHSDRIEKCMAEIGVQASKLHRPNHLHTGLSRGNPALPNVLEYYRQLTHIPCGWWVSSEVRSQMLDALKRG